MALNTSLCDHASPTPLPSELVACVFVWLDTGSFLQAIQTCRQFRDSANRVVLCHHLASTPGSKKDVLDNDQLSNAELLAILRHRAYKNLYGSSLTADRHDNVSRHNINPLGSAISGLDGTYVSASVSLRGGRDIRQYGMKTVTCELKETIESVFPHHPNILLLSQQERYVTVVASGEDPSELLVSSETQDDIESDDDDGSGSGKVPSFESLASVEDRLKHLNEKPDLNAEIEQPRQRTRRRERARYAIIRYDIYSPKDSTVFLLDPWWSDLVPRDLAVHGAHHCAIVWDRNGPQSSHDAVIIMYKLFSRWGISITCGGALIYPKGSSRPVSFPDTGHSSTQDETSTHPSRIAFYKQGKRLKLYEEGSVVPFDTINSGATFEQESWIPSNIVKYPDFSVKIDTPFFAMHESRSRYCVRDHLCLGICKDNEHQPKLNGDGHPQVRTGFEHDLCIIRSYQRLRIDDCARHGHRTDLSSMSPINADNVTIAAYLTGWTRLDTTVAGKDAVAVSERGTRIAIAQWSKVLVYPVEPYALIDDNSSFHLPRKKGGKLEKKAMYDHKAGRKEGRASVGHDYYRRTFDERSGFMVAVIEPIELDLDGAIAHKMTWKAPKRYRNKKSHQHSSSGENAPACERHPETTDLVTRCEPASVAELQADTPSSEISSPLAVIRDKDEVDTMPRMVRTIAAPFADESTSSEPNIASSSHQLQSETDQPQTPLQQTNITPDTSLNTSPDTTATTGTATTTNTNINTSPNAHAKTKASTDSTPTQSEDHDDNSNEELVRTDENECEITENELVILTDRGISVWTLGPGTARRRTRSILQTSRYGL